MGFSCGDGFDKKDNYVPLRDETGEIGSCSGGGVSTPIHGVEPDVEFKPIEHPTEPSDEDQPVKCPMPDSSILNDGETREERFTESLRKRAELSLTMVNEEGMVMVATEPPARAVRKRHHTLTRDRTVPPLFRGPPLPPLPTQNSTIIQELRRYNEFES